jgi:hypothetical protein
MLVPRSEFAKCCVIARYKPIQEVFIRHSWLSVGLVPSPP